MFYSVHVGGVPSGVTKEKLRRIFSQCGEVAGIFLSLKPDCATGYAFVHFSEQTAVLRAVQNVGSWMVHGKMLRVEIAHSTRDKMKQNTPRRYPSVETVTRDNSDRSRLKEACCSLNREVDVVHGDNQLDVVGLVHRMEKNPSLLTPTVVSNVCAAAHITEDSLFASIGTFSEEPEVVKKVKDKVSMKLTQLRSDLQNHLAMSGKDVRAGGQDRGLAQQQSTGRDVCDSKAQHVHTSETFKAVSDSKVVTNSGQGITKPAGRPCRDSSDENCGHFNTHHSVSDQISSKVCSCVPTVSLPGHLANLPGHLASFPLSNGALRESLIYVLCCEAQPSLPTSPQIASACWETSGLLPRNCCQSQAFPPGPSGLSHSHLAVHHVGLPSDLPCQWSCGAHGDKSGAIHEDVHDCSICQGIQSLQCGDNSSLLHSPRPVYSLAETPNREVTVTPETSPREMVAVAGSGRGRAGTPLAGAQRVPTSFGSQGVLLVDEEKLFLLK